MLNKWEDIPDFMKNDSVKLYYNLLNKKRFELFIKRIFDIILAIFTMIILSPLLILISFVILFDSKGPIMYCQVRVTQYGKNFKIYKFRTMINNADQIGTQVTTKNDYRVTRTGRILRKSKLDEIPQLINIILGEMSFVGTRPEVPKYVENYTDEMYATLLLPAGITSEASIQYKDEERLLDSTENVDQKYIQVILPEKMRYNLKSIENFRFFRDIKTIIKTLIAMIYRRKTSKKSIEDLSTDKNEVKIKWKI
ncbi:sugar transferase [Rummeliibacillus pycnus]|uniref:sugar transferase n=1 Tax=Rummeliibacillus pycnus TaxID=101070 RepID=UPI003D282814